MNDRFKSPIAVMALIIREYEGRPSILLQRRQNTNYCNGMWDCAASGHVEANEPMTAAMARELYEEIGVAAARESLRMATISYSMDDEIYVDAFFYVDAYEGTPTIMEPQKCDGLAWFPLDALPGDMIPSRRKALENAQAGITFSEDGFDAPAM